jgi:hypothetical protein
MWDLTIEKLKNQVNSFSYGNIDFSISEIKGEKYDR